MNLNVFMYLSTYFCIPGKLLAHIPSGISCFLCKSVNTRLDSVFHSVKSMFSSPHHKQRLSCFEDFRPGETLQLLFVVGYMF